MTRPTDPGSVFLQMTRMAFLVTNPGCCSVSLPSIGHVGLTIYVGTMRRTILFLTLGTFSTALLISLFSVYILHDVDQDKVGHLNQAFAGLCAESIVFALILGAITGLFTAVARSFFPLNRYESRPAFGIFLGACVTVCQYPWDFFSRKLFPKFADLALGSYLVIASVLCVAILLRDALSQGKADSI